jgi:guanylate kinase
MDPVAANAPARRGTLFVLSAPSGAGKTTLRRAVLARFPGMTYSVSTTTRPPRPGEVDGRDYVFIPPAEFEAGIREGRWAEWAQVHGNYYGTSAHTLREAAEAGTDVLLDIDVQGARQIAQRFPECVTVFIMPPSFEALAQRLTARGTDSPESVALRLRNARQEMEERHWYRHIVVNDELATAVEELSAIIASYR